ncbi:MAG: VanW family protein [Lachnospiraceae bacterium]|nr:VanW family protein [Lachnospiraceae bacterium]
MKKILSCLKMTMILILAAVLPSAAAQAQEQWENGLHTAMITVDGREIDPDEEMSVQTVIGECVEERLGQEFVIRAGDEWLTLTAETLGLCWANPELETYVKDALACPYSCIPLGFQTSYTVDAERLTAQILPLIESASLQPENGVIYKENERLLVSSGARGRSYSAETILGELTQLLICEEDGPVFYEFPFTWVEPEISSRSLSFSEKPLGDYTTLGLGEPGRENNVKKSSAGINGTLVMPGETFSALTMYGPVTAENGYMEALTYNSGRQIPGIGGGICQTTTTLYNAALLAELEIVYRRPHSMIVSYVPPSLDAMVDYASWSDLVIRNNTEYPIYLESTTGTNQEGRGYINVRIWGTETRPANRTVEYTYEVLAVKFPSVLYKVNQVNDSYCTVGLVELQKKFYLAEEVHPFVQSRAYKVVKVDGQEVSRTALPGGHGSIDQYREASGVLYHASDNIVDYWVVQDPNTYLGTRVHYQIMFRNGQPWDLNTANVNYY